MGILTLTKHQSILDAEARVAAKDAEDIRYAEAAKPAWQFIGKDIYKSLSRPVEKGWLNKTYYCPVHTDVKLHVEVVKHKYNRYQ